MTLKRKTIITAPYSLKGGVSSFVRNITPYFNSDVVEFYRGSKSINESTLVKAIAFCLLPLRFLVSLLNHKPQCIIVNTSLSDNCLVRDGLILCVAKLFRKKVLLIVHGFDETALKRRTLLKLGYFRSDSIIVLATSFKILLERAGYKRKIYVEYNPVHNDCYTYLSKKQDRDFSLFENIMFLSRIETIKGVFTAIEAFRLTAHKHPNIKLTVAGDGRALAKAMVYVDNIGIQNVSFSGFISGTEKLNSLYSNDIFLFPTEHNEGLPISVLEAMAAGQVIISRPVGGLTDLFNECNYGFNLNSTDPRDFSKAICKIFEQKDKYAKVRSKNAEFAKNHFHSKIIAKRIENIIADI